MFGKLIAILAQAKGAAVTTVLLAGAATATVTVSTNPEVQTTFDNVTTSIGATLSAVTQNAKRCVGAEVSTNATGGQPEVVAQRNAADKLLRDAWQNDHKKLTDLRGGKDVDNKAVGDIVKNYQDQLKDRLDKALNDVAALTLGREGQVRKAPSDSTSSATDSTTSAGSPSDGTKSAKPTCPPAPAPGDSTGSASAPRDGSSSHSPRDGSSSGSPRDGSDAAKGRVAVANRTMLSADIKSIVDKAIKDMDDLAKKATDEAAKLPAVDRAGGKPEDKGKSDDKGKPSDKPGNGNGNKPSASPRA